MEYSEVMKLTPEELRIKCAELEGWTVQGHGTQKNGSCLYAGNKFMAAAINRPTLENWIKHLPDYSQPDNYMRLMEKIWEKEPNATIWRNEKYYIISWNIRYVRLSNKLTKIESDTLGEAIQRAYLIICG